MTTGDPATLPSLAMYGASVPPVWAASGAGPASTNRSSAFFIQSICVSAGVQHHHAFVGTGETIRGGGSTGEFLSCHAGGRKDCARLGDSKLSCSRPTL